MSGNLQLLSVDSHGFLRMGNTAGNDKSSARVQPDVYTGRIESSTSGSTDTVRREKEWIRAILGSDTLLVTPGALLLALRHQVPVHVIRFLLTINPSHQCSKDRSNSSPGGGSIQCSS
jgi:hypothetical protein